MRNARTALILGSTLLVVWVSSSAASAASPGTVPNNASGGTPAVGEATPTITPGTNPSTPQPPSPAPTATPAIKQLSNELTLDAWAHPESPGPIYARPTPHSRRLAKIHLYTADGFLEVYPLLDSYIDAGGNEWLKVRIPGRPNGRTGWVSRELLASFQYTRWRIAVNRETQRMHVYYAGRLVRVFPVGVGKPSTPTPAGHFWVDERFKLTNPNNPYYPYALGTSDYSTLPNWPGEGVIGIHGPYGEPQRIPGDPSHGCIRMLDPDIAWLGPRITLGTPVEVI
jgi:hypothetical protein